MPNWVKWGLIASGTAFVLTWICLPDIGSLVDKEQTERKSHVARYNTPPVYERNNIAYDHAFRVLEHIESVLISSEQSGETSIKEKILEDSDTYNYLSLEDSLIKSLIKQKEYIKDIKKLTEETILKVMPQNDVALGVYGPNNLNAELRNYLEKRELEWELLRGEELADEPEEQKDNAEKSDGDSEEQKDNAEKAYKNSLDEEPKRKSVEKMKIKIVSSSSDESDWKLTSRDKILIVRDAIDKVDEAIEEAIKEANLEIEISESDTLQAVKENAKKIAKLFIIDNPNLQYDKEATDDDREDNAAAVNPVLSTNALPVFLGTFLLSLATIVSAGVYCVRVAARPGVKPTNRQWTAYGVCLAVAIVALRIGVSALQAYPGIKWAFPALLLPVGIAAGLTAVVVGPAYGLLATVILSVLAGMMGGIANPNGLSQMLVLFVAGCSNTFALMGLSRRTDLLKMSFYTTGAALAAALSTSILQSGISGDTLLAAGTAVGAGFLSSGLIPVVLPLFEFIAGTGSDMELRDLSDLNHPLLALLQKKAPGTFDHSIKVARLAEAAAEELGENVLLARVGAYYHDAGKTNAPQYFIENQKDGENPHDTLSPPMSARILTAHVRDGVELARSHRLPQAALDLIQQHHGSALIRSFYFKARQTGDPVEESTYRYPGPKPQTKLAAIILLADSIEAAASAKFQRDQKLSRRDCRILVQEIVDQYLHKDNQLDECNLTLRDLRAVTVRFESVLGGMYHSRIQYPDDRRHDSAPTELGAEKDASTIRDGGSH